MKNTPTKTKELTVATDTVINTEYEKIFNEDMPLITAAIRDKYYRPSMAMHIYLEEAEGYAEVLSRTVDHMVSLGYQHKDAELFNRRVAGARTAQATMKSYIDEQRSNNITYKKLFPEGKKLRDYILERMKTIVEGSPHKADLVKSISKGKCISDTIEDLFELGKMGENMIPELAVVKVSVADINKAKELATTLGRLHKASKMDSSVNSESRIIRDKAVTLLEESIKNLRTWARIVYKKDKVMRMKFFSQHTRNKSRKEKPIAIENSETTTPSSNGEAAAS